MTAPALPRPTATSPCKNADPELWFNNVTARVAGNLCRGCPVLAACAAYALAVDVQGTWGGTTYDQRRRIRKRRGVVPIPMISNSSSAYRTVDHGTEAGAKAHRRRYERPCEPCRKAEGLAHAERRDVRAG